MIVIAYLERSNYVLSSGSGCQLSSSGNSIALKYLSGISCLRNGSSRWLRSIDLIRSLVNFKSNKFIWNAIKAQLMQDDAVHTSCSDQID